MKPSSAKAKGRKFQQWIRDKILNAYPNLEPDDVRSTSMGAGGEDIQMSPAARKLFPFTVEAKHNKSFAIYTPYKQAQSHDSAGEPIAIIKANNEKPLAVIDAEYFIAMTKCITEKQFERIERKMNRG